MFKKLLTDPKEHNPNNFIYLVHSLLDWSDSGISPQKMRDKVNRVRDPNQFYRASLIAHLDEESAKERIGWYGGEVYQVGTFGNIGIIIEPAYDDLILIAWNCDLGSPWDPKELEKFVQKHKGKIRSPLILLTQTKGLVDTKYNELILKGDKNTAVKGVFFKLQDSKTEDEAKQLREIVSELMQSEVPVIKLPTIPIKNYDIRDPKERERMQSLDFLRAQNEIVQPHLEFYQPELFRDIYIERNYQNHVGLLREDYNDRNSGRDLLLNHAHLLGIPPKTIEANVQYLYSIGADYNNGLVLGTKPQTKRRKLAWVLRELFDYPKEAPLGEKKEGYRAVQRMIGEVANEVSNFAYHMRLREVSAKLKFGATCRRQQSPLNRCYMTEPEG